MDQVKKQSKGVALDPRFGKAVHMLAVSKNAEAPSKKALIDLVKDRADWSKYQMRCIVEKCFRLAKLENQIAQIYTAASLIKAPQHRTIIRK